MQLYINVTLKEFVYENLLKLLTSVIVQRCNRESGCANVKALSHVIADCKFGD